MNDASFLMVPVPHLSLLDRKGHMKASQVQGDVLIIGWNVSKESCNAFLSLVYRVKARRHLKMGQEASKIPYQLCLGLEYCDATNFQNIKKLSLKGNSETLLYNEKIMVFYFDDSYIW